MILGKSELPGSNTTIHNTQMEEAVNRFLDVAFFSSIVTAEVARCAVKRIDMDDILLLEKSLARYRALPSTHHIFYLFDLLDLVINHTKSRTLQEFYLLHKSSFFLGSYLSNQMEQQKRDQYLLRCRHLLTLLSQGNGGRFADQFGGVMSDLFEEAGRLSAIIRRSP